MSKIKQGDGYYYISLWNRPYSLDKLIDKSLQYVWIVNHDPCDCVHWWKCKTQIKQSGYIRDVYVRGMQYDILINIDHFLSIIDDFADKSIVLFQMDKPVPDTLLYFRLPELQRRKILSENGILFGIEFFIKGDIGCIWSVNKDYLERLLNQQEILELTMD